MGTRAKLDPAVRRVRTERKWARRAEEKAGALRQIVLRAIRVASGAKEPKPKFVMLGRRTVKDRRGKEIMITRVREVEPVSKYKPTYGHAERKRRAEGRDTGAIGGLVRRVRRVFGPEQSPVHARVTAPV